MSELTMSSSSKKTVFKTSFAVFVSKFIFSCCLPVFSQPLYFCYFLFFSPYIVKLLGFISPLFVTTSLVLVSLLLSVEEPDSVFEDSRLCEELEFYKALFEASGDSAAEEEEHQETVDKFLIHGTAGGENVFLEKEEFGEIFTEVKVKPLGTGKRFPMPMIHGTKEEEGPVEEYEEMDLQVSKALENVFQEKEEFGEIISNAFKAEGQEVKVKPVGAGKRFPMPMIYGTKEEEDLVEEYDEMELPVSRALENVFQEKEEFGEIMSNAFKVEGQEVKVIPFGTLSKKVVDEEGSNAEAGDKTTPRRHNSSRNYTFSGDGLGEMSPGLAGSFGSMRKEKEWRRTLACKLFEERHNAGGGGEDGMDLLWEKYEDGPGRRKERRKKGSGGPDPVPEAKPEPHHEDEEDANEEPMCCLQALKFSAGKMNLGLGRPNVMKISRALRGIGWLHNVRRQKNM